MQEKFMNFLFIQSLLASNRSNGEDTVWITILVLVVLAAAVGLAGSIRKKNAKSKERQGNPDHLAAQDETGTRQYKWNLRRKNEARKKLYHDLLTAPQEPKFPPEVSQSAAAMKPRKPVRENIELSSGMEIIETVFLINLVEGVLETDFTDVSIRKLAFNELVRRGLLCKVDGTTLKVYALNRNNLYGKTIQCEALKELAVRTSQKSIEPVPV